MRRELTPEDLFVLTEALGAYCQVDDNERARDLFAVLMWAESGSINVRDES